MPVQFGRIKYYCPCRETEKRDDPEFSEDEQCFFSLEELYFCQDCGATRCCNCIDVEAVSWFCPTCFFEVSANAAQHSSNSCPRNCLLCGQCGANMVVVAEDGDQYSVKCAVCSWKFSGLTKKSTFASQVGAKRPDEQNFEQLERFFTGKPSNWGAQEPTEVLPRPVRLHCKFKKYCRACRGVLVLPDLKGSSAKLAVKSMAISLVPNLETYTTSDKWMLKMMNPLPIPVKLSFSTRDAMYSRTSVVLGPVVDKHDELSLAKQVPECFIERETTASRQAFMSGVRKKEDGYEEGPNWASVAIESTKGSPVLTSFTIRYETSSDSRQVYLWARIFR